MRRPAPTPVLAALLLLACLPSQTARAQAGATVPDAAPWEAVLQAHATKTGMRYAALAADPTARKALDTYLAAVARMPESAPLSAWLNAYNATVVSAVLARYPLASVMDVPGFFKRQKHTIAGKQRTLDEVEHGIIRKRFPDARVHVALNCGARSCPPLHPHAFTEAGLAATLDKLSRAMVRDRRHVRLEADGGLAISALFFWFEADFKRDFGSPQGFIRKYGGAPYAAVSTATKTRKLDYDWRLNDAK